MDAIRSHLLTILLTVLAALAAGPVTASEQPAWWYLVDDHGELSAEAVLAPSRADQWRPLPASKANFGFSRDVYWFRMRLPEGPSQPRVLVIDNPHLDAVDFYLVVAGEPLVHHVAGDGRPFAARPIAAPAPAFPVQPTGRAGEVLLRMRTDGVLRVPVRLMAATDFYREQQHAFAAWAAAGALAFLLVVLHVAAFAASGRWLHLGVVLLVLSLGLFYITEAGLAQQYLWPQAAGFHRRSAPALIGVVAAVFSLFALALLRAVLRVPPLLYGGWAGLCSALVAALALLPTWIAYRLLLLFGPVAVLVGTVVGAVLWLRGGRGWRHIGLAWLVLCSVPLLTATCVLGPFGANCPLTGSHPLLMAAATALFSLALLLFEHQRLRDLLERQGAVIRRLRLLRAQPQHVADAMRLRSELQRRERQLASARVELARLRQHDAEVGGVMSRATFDRRYRIEWRRAYRERQSLTLILVALDAAGEPLVADEHPQHGHRLDDLAALLKETFRRPSDIIARFAPATFAVLTVGGSEAGAVRLAELVIQRFTRLDSACGAVQAPAFTLSAGVARVVPDERHHEAVLISFADDALYCARAAGGSRAVRYRPPERRRPLRIQPEAGSSASAAACSTPAASSASSGNSANP
jgi:diguanylate cyclase (GGDEF)-like protein